MAETKKTNTGRTRTATPVDNTYGHLQPQALDVEKAVLGALMIDRDAYAVVCEMLNPESFYEPRHQKIYTAITELSMSEQPVDMLTVSDQLGKDGCLEAVGGPAYIAELTSRVSSSANIEYHARIIAQKSTARQLISFASNIETKAFDETTDIDDLMQEAEGSLFELSQRNMKKDYTQIDPVISDALKVIQKASANKDGLTGVPTGYHKLDDITSGWQASDLVIIAGRPAMGKTSFALSMAKNIAADYQVPMAFFSLEMSNVQLVNRLISNACEIKGSKILNGQLQPDEWERLDKRVNTLLGAFTDAIIEAFKAGALLRWKTELISRIIPENRDIVRACKEIVSDYVTDQDSYNWNKINGLRCYLAKDSIDEKSLFTLLKTALVEGDYETASGLQVEMYDKMEELKALYDSYQKNMI